MFNSPVDDGLLSIGSFSRASSLSIKTLRAYHENGLLIPARVDPATGYRSYTVDQLADAVVIVRLRELEVPIAKVHQILQARDPALTRQILEDHQATMQSRLAETQRIIDALQSGIAPTAHTPVHLITSRHQPILTMHDVVPAAALWSWLVRAHDLLAEVATRAGGEVSGPPGAFYPAAIEADDVEDVTAFVPLSGAILVPDSAVGVTNAEFPAACWAVLVHADSFDTVGDTYRWLGSWVANNATASERPVCERYHAAESIEVLWPVVG